MSEYHMMLADDIKERLEALPAEKRAEIEVWAKRIRAIVEAAEPYGWFALALVTAEWTLENRRNKDDG